MKPSGLKLILLCKHSYLVAVFRVSPKMVTSVWDVPLPVTQLCK